MNHGHVDHGAAYTKPGRCLVPSSKEQHFKAFP